MSTGTRTQQAPEGQCRRGLFSHVSASTVLSHPLTAAARAGRCEHLYRVVRVSPSSRGGFVRRVDERLESIAINRDNLPNT
eukprot:6686071-Prymnesium_polylepis.1